MPDFNIRDFGARGDGQTNDAAAIQTAIETCSGTGGGRVLVPSGATFLAGSILLQSGVDLHLERGAVLQCSGQWADITERWQVTALSSGVLNAATRFSGSFITARGASNVAISGPGIVDGGGRHYVIEDLGQIYRMPVERPFTVFLHGCSGVDIRDTQFRDGALWTVRLTGCDNVGIRGLRITGDMKLPNADGIDLDHCRNVRISDCFIATPDDCISLKTCEEFPDAGPCENIVVTNCVLQSRSSALVVGVDVSDPIRNVIFSHCVIRDSHRGLSVNMGQDSRFENILFSDIIVETRLDDPAWWGRGEPIYVSAMPWHDAVGTVRNVRFANIIARGENGVHVEGAHPGLIAGLVFDNVQVTVDSWSGLPGGHYDRRPYSGAAPIYAHPTAGFMIAQAHDVTLRNCEVRWGATAQPWQGHALETRAVTGLVVENLRGQSAHPGSLAPVSHA